MRVAIFAVATPVATSEKFRLMTFSPTGRCHALVGDIARHQRITDNDAPYVDPDDMLASCATITSAS
jgi:hypothetical protein